MRLHSTVHSINALRNAIIVTGKVMLLANRWSHTRIGLVSRIPVRHLIGHLTKSVRICQGMLQWISLKLLLKAQITKVKVIHRLNYMRQFQSKCCVMSCLQQFLARFVYVWKFTPGSVVPGVCGWTNMIPANWHQSYHHGSSHHHKMSHGLTVTLTHQNIIQN